MTEEDLAMLEFERAWWKYAGAKEQEIRTRFGIEATAYDQRLDALLDMREALEADPVTVNRLRRLRASAARR
jgi:Protein of unknown function (DUF3263)